MHEKATQLTQKTKEVLTKKDVEIEALKKEIKERGAELPHLASFLLQNLPLEKEARLIAIAKQKIAYRDYQIKELKNFIAKLNKSTKESPVQKVAIVNPQEKINIGNYPDEQKVFVKNQPEVQKVKVENQPEIQKVRVVGQKDIEFPKVQKVEVTNPPEKSAGWVPELVVLAVKGIADMFTKLWARGLSVKVDDSERPIRVVVVDMYGRPIKHETPAVMIPMMMGGGGARKDESPSKECHSGQMTITSAGTNQVLGSDLARSITIKAFVGNTGNIYVGDSSVSSATGFILAGGDTVSMDIGFLDKIFIDADVNGEGVSFIYIK